MRTPAPVAAPWWKRAVFYQVCPRLFADSDGDGIGDLEGLRCRLSDLSWLGIDAVWICPFYPSPLDDFGYDVAEYCDVDPSLGTLADFDRLVADAHARGIRVILDWVPNHTSDRHPWFVESRSSRHNPKRDWYLWRATPNNWRAAFGGPAWTWDPTTGEYYLHLFLPSQPDLDWRNPEVVDAMHGVLRFWLDRGVDGFRVDAVQGLAKDPGLPDDPPYGVLPRSVLNDHPDVHGILRDLRRVVDAYPGGRVLVGEVYLLSTRQVARYLGRGDQLHLAFDFTSLYAPWDARAWRACIERVEAEMAAVGGWPTWTLSNHDNPRHRTRHGGSEARARAAAVLLLTLRGTPFLYYGEELGLADADVAPEGMLDPGGRDGCRAPMPWEEVAAQRADRRSVLHLYRRLVKLRRTISGPCRLRPDTPGGVLAYERGEGHTVLVNFGGQPAEVPGFAGVVAVASDGAGEGRPFEGRLAPDTAVILATPARRGGRP